MTARPTIPALLALLPILLLMGCGKSTSPKQPPSVTVSAPNGGESFFIGVSHGINYSATDPDTPQADLTIGVDYSTDGGTSWIAIATGQANTGTYVWVVPNTPTSQCRVRVGASDGAREGSDTSDANFSILPQPTQESVVSIGSATGTAGSEASVPLELSNESAVSALQTDVQFDPSIVSYASGAVTDRGVGMTYSATLVEAGTIRVSLSYAGATTLPVGSGTLANLVFSLVAAGESALTPTSTILSDPQGQPLAVTNRAGSITVEPGGPTAEELTADGWAKFEAGNFTGALEDFDAAIDVDDAHGPAYVGQGWSRLSLSTSAAAYGEVLDSFDAAYGLGETGAEVRSGRAAAHLAIGGDDLGAAITEAAAARDAAPDFAFEHRESFDIADLHLIEAFAHAGRAELDDALAAADEVTASGIESGDSGTWVVDGTTYPSFESAVLAFLHKLSAEVAG